MGRDYREILDQKYLDDLYSVEDHYWWYRGIRYFVMNALERLPEFEQLLQKPLRALDTGCGTGGNMVMLSRYGKVLGLDYLLECVRRCHARRLPACQASILEMPFKRDSFDLVASFDMLVCLDGDKDVKALRNLYEVCRPGGLLIITVAAFQFLYGSNSVVTGELHRYTRGELKAKVEQAGFKILKLTYRNMVLFPVFVAVRALKSFQRKKTSDIYSVSPFINSILFGLLKLDAWLSSWFDLPVGSAVFCIAQKPK